MDLWPIVGVTPERRRRFHLTEPWVDNDYVLVSLQRSPLRAISETAGRQITYARLPVTTQLAQRLFPDARQHILDSRAAALQSVCRGEAAAAFVEERYAEAAILDRPPGCESVALTLHHLSGVALGHAIGAVPDAADAADALRDEIGRLSADGTISRLIDTWAPLASKATRSLDALEQTRRRTRWLNYGLTGVALAAAAFVWQARRQRRSYQALRTTQRELAAERERWRLVLEGNNDGLFDADLCTGRVFQSARWKQIIGEPEEASEETASAWEDRIHPDDRPKVFEALRRHLDRELPLYTVEYRILHGDGSWRWILARGRAVWNEQGLAVRLVSSHTDITERVSADRERERLLAQRTALLESAGNAIYGVGADGECTYINARAAELLGYSRAECLGQSMHKLIHRKHADGSPYPESSCPIYHTFRQGGDARVDDEVFWRKDGTSFPVGYHARPVLVEGKIVGSIVTFADIAARKQAESQLVIEALTDSLTGLANRRQFERRLEAVLATARPLRSTVSVAFCDLDRFKEINDTYGHAAGDEVLATVGRLLGECVRSADLPARLSGDEFAIVLPQTTEQEAANCIDRIRERLETICFGFDRGTPFSVTATFGVAQLTSSNQNGQELMAAADQALYRAKREGRNRTRTSSAGS